MKFEGLSEATEKEEEEALKEEEVLFAPIAVTQPRWVLFVCTFVDGQLQARGGHLRLGGSLVNASFLLKKCRRAWPLSGR